MGNLRYIFMLIVSLFNQRIQYFLKLNKISILDDENKKDAIEV